MKLTVDIDPSSGFCAGVIKAISTAEEYLRSHARPSSASSAPVLYSLGAIVHNDEELARLGALGLKRIDSLSLLTAPPAPLSPSGSPAVAPEPPACVPPVPSVSVPAGSSDTPVLIRAHGEPPQTYREAAASGIRLIDCTCPVVIRLQKSIREAWQRLAPKQGTLLIFGKKGHAEVLGLLGQTDGRAVVVESVEELERNQTLDTDRDIEIFSQTTKNPVEYRRLCETLAGRMKKGRLTVHDSICKQVSSRHKSLADFAVSHDIIIFASGKSSSNGKVLFDLCRSCNPRSYALESADGLDAKWFREGDRVGVCGATSTPKWLLERIKNEILTNNY